MSDHFTTLRSNGLKPGLKMKVVKNTCDREPGETKSVNENYLKSSVENVWKKLPFREIYVKH